MIDSSAVLLSPFNDDIDILPNTLSTKERLAFNSIKSFNSSSLRDSTEVKSPSISVY